MIKKLYSIAFILISVSILAQTPILNNFRIENSAPSKVYFDADGDISNLTKQGFIINGKTISSINVSEKFFTVSTPFTFWDNNTIRLENGDGTVFDFTLTFIENNISVPAAATNRYVSVSGAGKRDGTNEANAWTLAQAFKNAKAGQTVWVKAGLYSYKGDSNLKIGHSGKATNPIKFKGYSTKIGDLDSDYIVDSFSYGVNPTSALENIDSKKWPVIKGNNTVQYGSGIFTNKRNYLIFKNIQIRDFYYNFWIYGSNYVHVENCTAANGQVDSKGQGIRSGTFACTNNRFYKNVAFNNGTDNFWLNGDYALAYKNKAYNGHSNNAHTDYQIIFEKGNYSIINDNYTYSWQISGNVYQGHGIGTKQNTGNKGIDVNNYLLISNNEINHNSGEAIWTAHQGTHNAVIKNNTIKGVSGYFALTGLRSRNGSYDNIWEKNYVEDATYGFVAITSNENMPISSGWLADNVVVRNNIFNNVHKAIVAANDKAVKTYDMRGVKIYNNTFYNITSALFYVQTSGISFTNCEFKNNIVVGDGKTNLYDANASSKDYNQQYNNYYNTGQNIPSGIGNISANPNLDVNFTPSNTSLKSGVSLEGVEFDKNQRQRSSSAPTIGAIEMQDDTTGSIGPNVSICIGENAILTASGGTSYQWDTGETTASISVSPLESNTYTVTVTNGNESDQHAVTVTVNEPPSVNAGEDVTICFGEIITLTAIGTGNFLWSTGETTASISVNPADTTTYFVTASNTCNTDVTDEIIINVIPEITLDAGEDVTICSGENVTLTASGNKDFLWNTGETTVSITVSPASTTTYTVTSVSGTCSLSDEVTVTVNEPPAVNAGEDVTLCYGESKTLTAEGNGDFLWNTGETTASITVSPTETTTYSVIASNSCSIEITDDVIVTVTPGINLTTTDDIEVCTGETDIVLTADSNGDYLWSTGETTPTITVNPASTTKYSITTSLGDCSKTDEIIVTVNQAPTVNAGSDVSLCSGESITLTAIGIGDFLWSNGETTASITVSPTETATYSVIASNSCSDPVSDEVIVNVTPAITLEAGIDVTLCSGESTTLTATSNGTILWSTGETSASIVVNPSSTTTYSVTSSSGECSLTDEVLVTINNFPSVSLGEDTKICLGESVTLTAVGTGNFFWSTGETTSSIIVNPAVTTTYSVSASTSCRDPETDEIIVIVNDLPVVNAGSDVTIAKGSSTVLTAVGEGKFLWSNGETSSSITVSPTANTTYTVTSTSLEGCSSQDNVIVTVSENSTTAVNIDAVPNQNICLDESVTLIATGGSNYLWSTGETTASITVSPTETTIYAVTISNGSTVDVDDITIFVDETCSVSANRLIDKESKIYPNPTQGQLNIELAGFNDESNISVFDLNGRLVHSENIDNYSPVKILKRKINLSRFGKGIYFVRLINNNTSETKKVLVI